jgi:adenylate cyclase
VTVAIACTACGAGLRDGARFCDSCGTPVATADSRAEYKQVTVLFADVVHSMDIAAAVGAERLREIMGDVFRRSSVVVQRYGGTVDKFTGDGIMAVFGAPVALEDHAVRACRAALDIQADVAALADDVSRRDGISLQLRIGLNSGEVITGEIGSGPMTYTAIGEQVGMAQRMESVAPAGGVMVSDSTARLVDTAAMLGGTEQVHIKGASEPVPAHRLLGMATGPRRGRAEPSFVGRQWELGALAGVLQRSLDGRGSIVGVVGPAGIGKSRIVRELTARATAAGAEVFATYCESHTTDVPFQAAAGLLRSTTGVDGLDDAAARAHVRQRFPEAGDDDLLMLEDLLGIADPDATLPPIDPDARRRRLAAVVKAAALSRTAPVVYVIEDAHWIDTISETLLAEFLAVIPQTPSLTVITYRPEYDGVLARAPRSQTIALEPLDDGQIRELGTELLGADGSVAGLTDLIAERAAGNPFFAEEIVRDLSERDVLIGGRGCYLCAEPVAEIHVPRTLQAVIAARIDRLDPAAKRTLNAAAVAGSRFTPCLLAALEVQTDVTDLLSAELIDQTDFGPEPEYTFRHPLIRAVAYESQLKSDRAQLHRRVAAAIEQDDANAALIAEHFEAAGELTLAYEWHMRSGEWQSKRDIAAAQLSWERALEVADATPADEPGALALRIAPRSLLCGSAWRRFHPDISARFDELRELCGRADDKVSLAIGMAGFVMEHVIRGRLREASQLATENMALIESIGSTELTLALSFPACVAKIQHAEFDDALRWSQAMIDSASGETAGESLLIGSPFALALAFRALARWAIGLPGWRDDIDQAIAISRDADAVSRIGIATYCYQALLHGVLVIDDAVLAEIADVTTTAEKSAEDINVVLAQMMMGFALVERGGSEADRGFRMLAELRETCLEQRYALNTTAPLLLWQAIRLTAVGELDSAVEKAQIAVEESFSEDNLMNADVVIASLVEALIPRRAARDLDRATAAIERLAAAKPGQRWAIRDIYVLRLRALLADANGDDVAYREFRDRYRAMAHQHGYEGHLRYAEEMV